MNEDLVVINDRPVAFLSVLLCCMKEEACAYGLTDLGVLKIAADQTQTVSLHNANELLANIL